MDGYALIALPLRPSSAVGIDSCICSSKLATMVVGVFEAVVEWKINFIKHYI